MKCDPKNAGTTPKLSSGSKKAVAAACQYGIYSTGTKFLEVAFVILKDLSNPPMNEEGCMFYEKFAITERSLWRIELLSSAVGWAEPFDCQDQDEVEKVIMKGSLILKFEEELADNGKTYLKIRSLNTDGELKRKEDGSPLLKEYTDTILQAESRARKNWGNSPRPSKSSNKEYGGDTIPF